MNPKILADMFVGVEVGYQGDKAHVVSPREAAQMLASYASSSSDHSSIVRICPAIAVYSTARGCPDGGEAVALVTLAGDKENILAIANSIYEHFKQTTLSICTHDLSFGLRTRGFLFSLEGDLQQIGHMWQEISNDRIQKTGMEISCGVFQNAPEQITVRADANPHKITNIPAWERAAVKTISALAHRLGKPIHPVFCDTGFTYLKKEV